MKLDSLDAFSARGLLADQEGEEVDSLRRSPHLWFNTRRPCVPAALPATRGSGFYGESGRWLLEGSKVQQAGRDYELKFL